ncbi:MAG TPA: M14 family metallopeptidase [Anaerolineaceae bacterium]|nr:M14 family metallopeptidase [Anaerolineaceae bacterium]
MKGDLFFVKKKTLLIQFLILIGVIVFFVLALTYFSPKLHSKATEQTIEAAVKTAVRLSEIPLPTEMRVPSITPTSTVTLTPIASATLTPTTSPTPEPTLEYTGKEIIGYTAGDNALKVYRFGRGEHPYLIIAGIHGGYEANTVWLADELVEYLSNSSYSVPEDKTLYILPMFNADGYYQDHGPDGRANSTNTDLNRNWDANWKKVWYGPNCWNRRYITAGTGPMSEPETQALADFVITRGIEAIISYHSAGLGIFYGEGVNNNASIELARAISLVTPYAFPPNGGVCEMTGQFADWASNNGIAAIDIELTNHTDTDFEINVRVLDKFLNWPAVGE